MRLKILLVNNKEMPQLGLEKFLQNYGEVTVIHFQSISIWQILKTYIISRPDLIVLSGSGEVPINFSLDLYKDELDLIKTTNFPILGICFGFEAIAAAYDEKLINHGERIEGLSKIKLKSFQEENDEYYVWQSHRWFLPTSNKLEVLAESERGVEIVKVPNKKVYGLQFHPEHTEPDNDGKKLFELVLKEILKK